MLDAAPFTAIQQMQVAEAFVQGVAKRTIEIAVENESAAIHWRSGKNRDDSYRSPCSSFDLDGQRDEDSPLRRELVEIGDVFKAIEVGTVDELMHNEVIRRTIVDARCIDADAVHPPLVHEKSGGLL